MPNSPVAPGVELSSRPSAYNMPENCDLGGAFGSPEADRIAAVLVIYSQACGRDLWEAAPRQALPKAITEIVSLIKGHGAAILTLFDGPYEVLKIVRRMEDDGLLANGSVQLGEETIITVIPTEKFLAKLAPFRR